MPARTNYQVPAAPVRYDAYFGMLVISLVATLTGLVFLGLDYSSYEGKKPPSAPPKPQSAAVAPAQ